jgi:low affinity Fe/Cu permease
MRVRETSNSIMDDFHGKQPSVLKRGNAQQRKLRARVERNQSRRTALHRQHLERAHRGARSRTSPFRRFAQAVSNAAGRPWSFVTACGLILVWGLTGPLFDFSDRWQLMVNSGTTIVTFLMVFLIQNTQNRDTEALRLKLDELLLATEQARKEFVAIEDLADEDLRELEDDLKGQWQGGGPDTRSEARPVR